MSEIERAKLVKEAHLLLDKIEQTIHYIVDDIKANKSKKAA